MIRVIVVDDHPVVRRGLRQIIEAEADMRVVGEAKDAREALQVIRQTDSEVVVLDIAMPGPSGFEVLNQLKTDFPVLPILIMSTYEEEQYANRAIKAGASGYLMKESLPEELIKAIRKIVAGGKYLSPNLMEKLALERTVLEAPLLARLSDREFEILRLIARGRALTEIGDALCISGKTVSTYRARILEKMGMKTNADLIAYALKNNLIE